MASNRKLIKFDTSGEGDKIKMDESKSNEKEVESCSWFHSEDDEDTKLMYSDDEFEEASYKVLDIACNSEDEFPDEEHNVSKKDKNLSKGIMNNNKIEEFSPNNEDIEPEDDVQYNGKKYFSGMSFIIGTKEKVDGVAKSLFDCVLCNEEINKYDGVQMNMHVHSRLHLMNAMKIQDYEIFLTFNNKKKKAPIEELVQTMISIEEKKEKQHLVPSNISSLAKTRKNLKLKIEKLLKEKVPVPKRTRIVIEPHDSPKKSSEIVLADMKVVDEASGSTVTENDVIETMKKFVYRPLFRNIVFFIYDPTFLDKNEVFTQDGIKFRVSYVKLNADGFDRLIGDIKKHDYFDKETLFIICTKILNFYYKRPDKCMKKKCRGLTHVLEKKSRNLWEIIDKVVTFVHSQTSKDYIIFTTHNEINLSRVHNKKRPCNSEHTYSPLTVPTDETFYNDFIKSMAKIHRFLNMPVFLINHHAGDVNDFYRETGIKPSDKMKDIVEMGRKWISLFVSDYLLLPKENVEDLHKIRSTPTFLKPLEAMWSNVIVLRLSLQKNEDKNLNDNAYHNSWSHHLGNHKVFYLGVSSDGNIRSKVLKLLFEFMQENTLVLIAYDVKAIVKLNQANNMLTDSYYPIDKSLKNLSDFVNEFYESIKKRLKQSCNVFFAPMVPVSAFEIDEESSSCEQLEDLPQDFDKLIKGTISSLAKVEEIYVKFSASFNALTQETDTANRYLTEIFHKDFEIYQTISRNIKYEDTNFSKYMEKLKVFIFEKLKLKDISEFVFRGLPAVDSEASSESQIILFVAESLIGHSSFDFSALQKDTPRPLVAEIDLEMREDSLAKCWLNLKGKNPNSMVMFVPDISLIGEKTSIEASNYPKGLPSYNAPLFNKTIVNETAPVYQFLKNFHSILGNEKFLCLPYFPRVCADAKDNDIKEMFIKKDLLNHPSKALLLNEGNLSIWQKSSSSLGYFAKNFNLKGKVLPNDSKDLANKKFVHTYWLSEENHKFDFVMKKAQESTDAWFLNLENIIRAINNLPAIEPPKIEEPQAVSKKEICKGAGSNSLHKGTSKDGKIEDSMKNNIMNDKNKELPKPNIQTPILKSEPVKPKEAAKLEVPVDLSDVNRSYQDFLCKLAQIETSCLDQPIDEIKILGPKKILDQLSNVNVKCSLITYNFSKTKNNCNEIRSKLGIIKRNTVCCIICDVSLLTVAKSVSDPCFKFSCRQKIPMISLKKSNSSIPMVNQQLQEIELLAEKMNSFVPTVLLPLFPTRIYCDNEETLAKHKVSHCLQNATTYVIEGCPTTWRDRVLSLQNGWNNLMIKSHENLPSTVYVQKFGEFNPEFLLIKENIEEFYCEWSAPLIWVAFVEAILESLVLSQREKRKRSSGQETIQTVRNPKQQNSSLVELRNFSNSIPMQFLKEFLETVDSEVKITKEADKIDLKFSKISNALLVSRKLNNLCLGNSTLLASIFGIEGSLPSLSVMQKSYINSIFMNVYSKFRPQIISNLKAEIESIVDVATYKTNGCNKPACKKIPQKECFDFHGHFDRRRNPFKVPTYSKALCRNAGKANGCPILSTCSSSHNEFEQNYHPSVFQASVCSFKSLKNCTKDSCTNAHEDTPEYLFTPRWVDLHLYGNANSLDFFTGAIRSTSKIMKTDKNKFKILFVTPNKEFMSLAENVVDDLTKKYSLQCTTLQQKWMDPGKYQVFIGHPSSFSQNQIFNREIGGALVVDSIDLIYRNKEDWTIFSTFLHKLKSSKSMVNKVFVSSAYKPDIAKNLRKHLDLPLKEIPENVKEFKSAYEQIESVNQDIIKIDEDESACKRTKFEEVKAKVPPTKNEAVNLQKRARPEIEVIDVIPQAVKKSKFSPEPKVDSNASNNKNKPAEKKSDPFPQISRHSSLISKNVTATSYSRDRKTADNSRQNFLLPNPALAGNRSIGSTASKYTGLLPTPPNASSGFPSNIPPYKTDDRATFQAFASPQLQPTHSSGRSGGSHGSGPTPFPPPAVNKRQSGGFSSTSPSKAGNTYSNNQYNRSQPPLSNREASNNFNTAAPYSYNSTNQMGGRRSLNPPNTSNFSSGSSFASPKRNFEPSPTASFTTSSTASFATSSFNQNDRPSFSQPSPMNSRSNYDQRGNNFNPTTFGEQKDKNNRSSRWDTQNNSRSNPSSDRNSSSNNPGTNQWSNPWAQSKSDSRNNETNRSDSWKPAEDRKTGSTWRQGTGTSRNPNDHKPNVSDHNSSWASNSGRMTSTMFSQEPPPREAKNFDSGRNDPSWGGNPPHSGRIATSLTGISPSHKNSARITTPLGRNLQNPDAFLKSILAPSKTPIRSSFDPTVFRNTLGFIQYPVYEDELRKLQIKFEEEYKVFEEIAGLHPNFEEYHEEFSSKYHDNYGYTYDENHKEELWNQFWQVKVKLVKEDCWLQKKKILQDQFWSKANSREQGNSDFRPNMRDCFSPLAALNLLENISSSLGMLGPSLLAIINKCRDQGIERGGLKTFIENENSALMTIILDKFRANQRTASRDQAALYGKAINWTNELIKLARSHTSHQSVNLADIARQSIGKEPKFIIQDIKNAYNRINQPIPSKENLNNMFINICNMQFKMSSM